MDLDKQLLSLRKEQRKSRRELSELSGVSESAIKQYETGKRQPRLEQLRNLAAALDTPLGDLVGVAAKDGLYSPEEIWGLDKIVLENSTEYKQFMENYHALNSIGQYKVHDYTVDLRQNPKYVTPDELSKPPKYPK